MSQPARLVHWWTDLLPEAEQLVGPKGLPARLKSPGLILRSGGPSSLFLNLRHDEMRVRPDGQVGVRPRFSHVLHWPVRAQDWTPCSSGTVLPIDAVPVPQGEGGAVGPADPRVIQLDDGQVLVVFNMQVRPRVRRMFVHHVGEGFTTELTVEKFALAQLEKNWMPFVLDGVLHFVYSPDPLVILRCPDPAVGRCEVVQDRGWTGVLGRLHGGTELHPWLWPNFVGFVHTCRPWRACLVILDAEHLRWRFVGPALDLRERPPVPEARPWRGMDVQFPTTTAITPERLLMGLEFETRCPALMALPRSLVEMAIEDRWRFRLRRLREKW